MPSLNWIGKEKIVNHDKDVPFRLMRKNKKYSLGNSENLILEGDNLEALKALMPFYYGKIKCIYIDPPYNTGNEKWKYNDNVNSPKIREWIGKTVGPEGDDLCRHDKWLCMMYPRLKLLYNLLSDDGVIFVSIDDNEHCNLKMVMDEIMPDMFVTTIHVQMSTVQGQKVRPAKQGNIVKNAEYILVFSKNKKKNIGKNPLYDVAIYDQHYSLFLEKNTDDYKIKNLGEIILKEEKILHHLKELQIIKNIKIPKITGKIIAEAYSTSEIFRGFIHKNASKIARYHDTTEVDESNIEFKAKVVNGYAVKYKTKNRSYLITKDNKGAYKQLITLDEKIRKADDFRETFGVTTIRGDWWAGFYLDMGNVSKEGDTEYKNGKKPVRLIKQLIKFSTDDNDLVLDSFAGSGTTAHAVLDLNKEDSGNRKFILVEMEKNIAKNITAERVKRVAKGYSYKKNGGEVVKVAGLGGGFEYVELGEPLFDKDGMINKAVSFEDMARYVYFTETKTNLEKKNIKGNCLGKFGGNYYFLLFDGIGKNILNRKFLQEIKKISGPKIVYADKCLLDEEILEKYQIIFRQIPYQVKIY